MFYAHYVLSKKGPLARVWLAAHWDKKLTKAHVFETNISSSVDAILEPQVKIALRTSGHLMLGVVRIYSRKAKYLLADCNEAFVKIKMAFRPGVVDLPDEQNREAAIAAITLPDNFHDFESTLADINDLDMSSIAVNQSRPEDITMREDFTEINLGRQDDDFGDLEFCESSEREVMRDASNISEALYKSGVVEDSESLLIVGEGSMMKGTPNKSGAHTSGGADGSLGGRGRSGQKRNKNGGGSGLTAALAATSSEDQEEEMDIDETLRAPPDDDFGDDLGGFDDNDDDFGGDLDNELFSDTANLFDDPSAQKQLEHITSEIESQMGATDLHLVGVNSSSASSVGGLRASTNAQGRNYMARKVETIEDSAHEHATLATNATAGVAVSLVDEAEAFALPPIDTVSIAGGESLRSNVRRQRKRRLIVDEHKSIPSEVMKSQMSDTGDIVATLDLAPPTKKLMYWKETGGVEKLLAAPGRTQISRGALLLRLFNRHLRTEHMVGDLDAQKQLVEQLDEQVQDLAQLPQERLMATIPEEISVHQEPQGRDKVIPHTNSILSDEASMLPPPPPSMANVNSSIVVPLLRRGEDPVLLSTTVHLEVGAGGMEYPWSHHGPPETPGGGLALSGDTPYHYGGSETPYPYNEPASVMSMAPPSVMPHEEDEEIIEAAAAAAAHRLQQSLEAEEAAALASGEAEVTEDYEERRLERRARVLLHVIKAHLSHDNTIMFKEMSHGLHRKQAAARFYTLLALRKQDAVELVQPEPFADIQVSRGPKFSALLAA